MTRKLTGVRIGCAMTGSFCTFKKMFEIWEKLREEDADLYPIMSFNAAETDTRFYKAKEAVGIFEEITGKKVWKHIGQVEPIGPKKLLDLLIVAPCTGNTLAKMANGITDTPAALAVKSHLRNGRPVLVAVSTNDGLGQSAKNIGLLLGVKNIYFVPFGQDDCLEKPNSLVAKFDLIPDSAAEALAGHQIQPILR